MTQQVAGRWMTWSLGEFERRALVLLEEESAALAPNAVLRDFLCEAVRLSREYADRRGILVDEEEV